MPCTLCTLCMVSLSPDGESCGMVAIFPWAASWLYYRGPLR